MSRNFPFAIVEIPCSFDRTHEVEAWGEMKIRHAGEYRHPGNGRRPSYRWKTVSRLRGWGWTPVFTGVTIKTGCAGMTDKSDDFEPRIVHFREAIY
jgi:hypothetical protein